MADLVYIRQGQDAVFSGVWTPVTGGPATLAGATVTSAVKDYCGNTVYGLVAVSVNNLDFTITYAKAQTTAFAIGPMQTDLRFDFGGSVTFSTKGYLEVTNTVTKE